MELADQIDVGISVGGEQRIQIGVLYPQLTGLCRGEQRAVPVSLGKVQMKILGAEQRIAEGGAVLSHYKYGEGTAGHTGVVVV